MGNYYKMINVLLYINGEWEYNISMLENTITQSHNFSYE